MAKREDYDLPPPKYGALSKYLNIKKTVDDAFRQNRWKREADWRQSQADINKQKISTAGTLASGGMMNPEQFRSATSYQDPYSGQQVPGMDISPYQDASAQGSLPERMSNAGIPMEEQEDYYVQPKTYLNKGRTKTVEAFMKKRVLSGAIVDDLGRIQATNDSLTRNMEMLSQRGIVSGPGYSTISGPGSDLYAQYTKSPEFNAWKASVLRTFQQYRKWATGVAAGYPELQMLGPLYPKPSDKPEIFIQKTRDILKENSNIMNRVTDSFGKAGYAVSGFKQRGQGESTEESSSFTAADEERLQELEKKMRR